ncbi:MAG: hypothetical protein LQ348_006584 [Seirophora lacunosa]|nr:MAG: hypothetical protein LQ348_006584 [Seirophora lacunosa]
MATTVDLVPVWDLPNDIPEKWVESVDENVASSEWTNSVPLQGETIFPNSGIELPAGSQVKGIFRWGFSHWTRTAKIVTEQADGTQKLFFLKVTQDEVGKAMVWGEYESMNALHSISPELTPAPIARGTFAQADNVHFFLCEFVDMTGDLPDVDTSMKMLAKLHTQSSSPNGRYGFHVPTLHGRFPQFTEWTESWEDFFTKSIRMVFDNEERSQGPDKEVQHLCKETLSKVVPRLLRPLETGGRHIKPCLIHGDLWDGNTSTNRATDTPVIFDATCIYAHNECKESSVFDIPHTDKASGTGTYAAGAP